MLAFEDQEKTSPAIIKVVGVGGAGMNAIERMVVLKLKGVELIAMNTDEQVLSRSNAHTKVHLGTKVTRGMGAGGRPEIGMEAAHEDRDKIVNALKGADMVFITAGMGGGTGTGASPVVVEVARELKALTVAVISLPLASEGHKKMSIAREGQSRLKEKVDALITIPNDALFKVIDRNTSVNLAFKAIDDVLARSVIGISDIINNTGYVNVDFKDVLTIMRDNGEAVIGVGEGVGESRVSDALQSAIHHPLLEGKSIEGARMVLINVVGGTDLTLYEYNEIQETIREMVSKDAHIIVGFMEDASRDESLSITVIATGFRQKQPDKMEEDKNDHSHDYRSRDSVRNEYYQRPSFSEREMDRPVATPDLSAKSNMIIVNKQKQPGLQFPDFENGTDNLDIPAIFRRKQ